MEQLLFPTVRVVESLDNSNIISGPLELGVIGRLLYSIVVGHTSPSKAIGTMAFQTRSGESFHNQLIIDNCNGSKSLLNKMYLMN